MFQTKISKPVPVCEVSVLVCFFDKRSKLKTSLWAPVKRDETFLHVVLISCRLKPALAKHDVMLAINTVLSWRREVHGFLNVTSYKFLRTLKGFSTLKMSVFFPCVPCSSYPAESCCMEKPVGTD